MYSNSPTAPNYLSSTTISISRPYPINTSNDPYNYTLNDELSRKSMINKLPGRKDINLGQYPEVALLFQAAEIQRLNSALALNRVNNKGVNKQILDRHSYEIQVKQLSAIIEQNKLQRQKLMRRIQQLNNGLNKNIPLDNNTQIGILSNKYERALLEIGKMYDDNTKLQQQINHLNQELQRARVSSNYISSNVNKVQQNFYEKQFQQQKQYHKQKQKQYEIQVSKLEQTILSLRDQLSQIHYKNSHQVTQLRVELQSQFSQYKNRINQQQRLTIQQMQDKINRLSKKITELNNQIHQLNSQKMIISGKVRQYQMKIQEYDSKIKNGDIQISRLQQFIKNSNTSHPYGSLSFSLTNDVINSLSNQNSIKSSYNPNTNNLQKKNSNNLSNQQLQNNVAMLSQQLQRLESIVRQKNDRIQSLQQNLSQQKYTFENQITKIRMNHQTQIRRILQSQQQGRQRINMQLQKARRQIQQLQQILSERTNKYRQQLMKAKQGQSRLRQQQWSRRIDEDNQKKKKYQQEIRQYRQRNSKIQEKMQEIQKLENKVKQQRRDYQLKYLQKLQEEQYKWQIKIRNLKRDLHTQHENKIESIQQEYIKKISIIQNKAFSNDQKVRKLEIQNMENVNYVKNSFQNKLKTLQKQNQSKIQILDNVLRERQLEISRLNHMLKYKSQVNYEDFRSQFQKIIKKIDYLSQQISQSKNSILETISYSKNNPSKFQSINFSLEHIENQLSTLSAQLMSAPLSQKSYDRYIKQLQSQCENYLQIIANKKQNNDSGMLKQIWQQIQNNNRYNREEQQKWRNTIGRNEQKLRQFYQQKWKWEEIKFQSLRIKDQCSRLQTIMKEQEIKYKSQIQNYKNNLGQVTNSFNNQLHSYHERIQQYQLHSEQIQKTLQQYMQQYQQQTHKIQNLNKMLQIKSKQLEELSNNMNEYKNKYIQIKQKSQFLETVIERVLAESRADLEVLDRLQAENVGLRRDIKVIMKQIQTQKNQKNGIIQKSSQQLQNMSKRLSQYSNYHQQYPPHEFQSQQSKILSLEKQFNRLQSIINYLRRDNYILTKQNYEQCTQQHINKQFSMIKLSELNKQIERLTAENVSNRADGFCQYLNPSLIELRPYSATNDINITTQEQIRQFIQVIKSDELGKKMNILFLHGLQKFITL